MMEYTFFWFIENYSYCWHKNEEILASPEFTTEALEGTAWTLELFPRGENDQDTGFISLFLTRSEHDDGPENFSLEYELSFLTKNGVTLCPTKDKNAFKTGYGHGESRIVQMDEVLVRRKSEYLPQDTLSVCCKMWWGEGTIQRIGQSCARTRIAVEKISFLHLVEGFSALESNQSNTVKIQSRTNEECIISSNLYCMDGTCCEEKIMVEITSSIIKFLSKCRFSLLDGSGNIIKCGQAINRFHVAQNDILKLPLSLTKKVIMARKSEYLIEDKLSLLCECSFSTGLEFQIIEETVYEVPRTALKFISNCKAAEKLPECSSALDDLKVIYKNQFQTDVVLKTKTTSFPAHKIILCARSSVFKAMLSNNMKEKISDCIEIEDLEDDVLKRLLLFLYSDNLEDLQWETATKLYYASDKYEIKKLKLFCSNFLKDNLNIHTAVELLLLADTHSDSDLKQFVEDFILDHDVQVFGSDEWENLGETYPQLAYKTMHLKYKRKK